MFSQVCWQESSLLVNSKKNLQVDFVSHDLERS